MFEKLTGGFSGDKGKKLILEEEATQTPPRKGGHIQSSYSLGNFNTAWPKVSSKRYVSNNS